MTASSRPLFPAQKALWVILALSVVLALGYAWAMPLGAAPDEGAHVQYVKVVATEGRIPALNTTTRRNSHADPDYESHQAPLYYVLAAPCYLVGRAVAGEPGAGQACRGLSILVGVLGAWLAWLLARELAPKREALWTAALAVMALLPMRLSIMASVSNDMVAEATATLALLLMVRAVLGPWGTREALALGGALGLSLLAKQGNIMLFPPALVAIFLASKFAPETGTQPAVEPTPAPQPEPRSQGRKRSSAAPKAEPEPTRAEVPGWGSRFWKSGVLVAVPVLLLSGWWFTRNHLLYGDPLGMRVFNWYFEDTRRWAEFREIGWSFGQYLARLVMPTTFATFWGAFGHLDPAHPELFMGAYGKGYPPPSWVYPPLLVLVLTSVAGGLKWYFAWRRAGCPPVPGAERLGIPVLHAVFVAAAFLNFNATYFQAQARYLFPSLGLLSLGLAGGWLEWARRREPVVAGLVGAGMLALATYALFGVLVPAFR